MIRQRRACRTELAREILIVYRRKVRSVLAGMIATRGFVRTLRFSRVRLSHFPTDAEALRVGHPQIRLVLICVLVCRGHCIPCSDCSSVDSRISLLILRMSKLVFARSIVLCCAAQIATESSLWSRGVARWFRLSLSFADPFLCRCFTNSTLLPFPHPAHRTGGADWPHPALGEDSRNGPSHGL